MGENEKDNLKNIDRIDVIDGIRVFALFFVVWFHFWQQSWLTPDISFKSDISKSLGLNGISLETIVRYGFDFVDELILISALCNFLPYAKSMVYKTKWPDFKTFYKKRAARILPSYYLSVIVVFILELSKGSYFSKAFMYKDLFRRLTFTSIFFPDTFNNSIINGVLWTVQIEFWFYVLIPWIALAFKKKPLITSVILVLSSVISIERIINFVPDYDTNFYKDFPLTYTFLYFLGMIIALMYYGFHKYYKENAYTKAFSLIALVSSVILYCKIENLYADKTAYFQLYYRMTRGILFSIMIISIMFSYKAVKVLFANRVMKFLAVISYNVYIWHQYIAVFMKEHHIPKWEGDKSPNIYNDKVWMWKYQIIIVVITLGVAILITYFFERPVAKKILKIGKKKVE